jgi:phage shock protein A
MGEAEDLRRQAKRALRLADSVSDQYAAQGLKALAAKFLERAQILEQDVMS